MKNIEMFIFKGKKDCFSWIMCIVLTILSSVIKSFLLIHILKKIIDDLLYKHQKETMLTILFVGLVLLVCILDFYKKKIEFFVYKNLVINIEEKLIKQLYLENRNVEEGKKIFSLMQTTIPQYAEKYVRNIIEWWDILVTVLVITIYTFIINVYAFIICLCISTIGLICMRNCNKKISSVSQKNTEAFNSVYTEILEIYNCLEIIPFLENNVFRHFEERICDNEKNQIVLSKYTNAARICMRFSSIGIVLIVSAYLGILNIIGKIPISDTFVMISLLPELTSALFRIPNQIAEFKELLGTKEYICKFFDYIDLHRIEQLVLENEDIKNIEISKIVYSYDHLNTIFSMDEVCVREGMVIGVSGASGSGKSTFLKILLKDIKQFEGSIKINRRDICEIEMTSMWQNIMYLAQQPIILPLSIEENIALCSEGKINHKNMERAIELAELNELLDNNRTDPIISIHEMSKGEIQKVCLARCFYTDKKIILLDEATSALSPKAGQKIIDNLLRDVRENNKILFIVSHDKNIINKCDYVINVNKKKH